MSTITIRNVNEKTKARLKLRAARKGLSMEEELRRILDDIALQDENEFGLGTRIRQIHEKYGLEQFDEPFVIPRFDDDPKREPIDFSGPKFGTYEDES